MSNALEKAKSFVFIEANVATKFSGLIRYKIYAQLNSHMLSGYNVVAFGKSDKLNW